MEPFMEELATKEMMENPDSVPVNRDGKLVLIPKSELSSSHFGKEAIETHRLRVEKQLANNNPEDSMEGANLFDEPIEPPTQVTTNNQNDPTN